MLTEIELLRIKQDIEESSDNSELIWHRDELNSLFEHIEQQRKEIELLNDELDEMTESRNLWRTNSLDWEGEEE